MNCTVCELHLTQSWYKKIQHKTQGSLDLSLFILDWDGDIGTIDNESHAGSMDWVSWLQWQWDNSSGNEQAQVVGIQGGGWTRGVGSQVKGHQEGE